jgi:hypothetical protein
VPGRAANRPHATASDGFAVNGVQEVMSLRVRTSVRTMAVPKRRATVGCGPAHDRQRFAACCGNQQEEQIGAVPAVHGPSTAPPDLVPPITVSVTGSSAVSALLAWPEGTLATLRPVEANPPEEPSHPSRRGC